MAAEQAQRIGERLRDRREALDLTQEDVARRLPGKTSGAQVSRWERGEHRPHDSTLERLADVLDVELSYFYASPADKNGGTPDLLRVGGTSNERLDRIEAKLDLILAACGIELGEQDAPAEFVEIFRDAAARAHAARQAEPAKRPQRRASR